MIIQLIFNLSLLIAASIVSGFAESIWKSDTFKGKILQGILFGLVALLGMFYPFVLAPGLFFDGRSVIISLCTLFFGPIAGFISAFITAVGRLHIGGVGAITGVSVISASFLFGWLFHHLVRLEKLKLNIKTFYVMGIFVHLAMLLLMNTLPSRFAQNVLQTISFTVIIFYPLATVLIGKILLYQKENRDLIEKLRDSVYKFNLITNYSKDCIWMTDLDFNYIFLSPSVELIYGYKADELIKKNALYLVSPESVKEAIRILNEELEIEAKRTKDPNRFRHVEFEITKKDGSKVIAEAVVTFVRDEKLNPIGLFGITRDITEKRAIENSIKESEEKYRLLVNNISDFIVKIDKEFNYIYKSDTFTNFFGINTNTGTFLDIFKNKDQIIKLFDSFKDKLEISFEQEIDYIGSKTVIFWKVKKVMDDDENQYYICIGRDITPLKIATEKIKESQELFKTIFQASPLIKFLVDKKSHKIVEYNNTFLRELKIGERNLEKSIIDLEIFVEKDIYKDIINKLNNQGTVRNFETIVKRSNGEIRNVLVSCDFIQYKGAEHILFAILDITERKLAEEKLQEINNELELLVAKRTEELNKALEDLSNSNYELKLLNEQMQSDAEKIIRLNEKLQDALIAKDKFFSIIAHDLKNPFLTLLNNSEMLLRYYDKIDEPKKLDMISKIRDASQSTYNLLENLLQWSRSQMGRIEVNPEFIDMHELVYKIITLVQSSASNKEIQILNKIPQETYALCDRDMTSTILRNLLTNAIKFSNKKTIIEVGLKEVTFKNTGTKKIPYAIFYVKDQGIGMSEDKLKKLFKISEIQATRGTEGEKGSGLGLLIVNEFIDKQSGNIWVESTEGEGTIFYFSLPMN